jgi:hypothetical protein
MSPGFRRKASPSILGLVRETAKVGARTDTSGNPVESVEPLLLHKRLDGFEGSMELATRRSGEIATVTNWESEETLRATEGPLTGYVPSAPKPPVEK